MYGMPLFDEELEQALKDEKIYLGGCCLSGADPKYHCFKCKKNFGNFLGAIMQLLFVEFHILMKC